MSRKEMRKKENVAGRALEAVGDSGFRERLTAISRETLDGLRRVDLWVRRLEELLGAAGAQGLVAAVARFDSAKEASDRSIARLDLSPAATAGVLAYVRKFGPTLDGILRGFGFRGVVAQENVLLGHWRPASALPSMTGARRPMQIYLARATGNLIKHTWHGDRETFCPPTWFDLRLGSGACGFACRFCFLMLTFRAMRDPLSPVIYDNVGDFEDSVKEWLRADRWPTVWERDGKEVGWVKRGPWDTLGLGIDCLDSLLYEGLTGMAQRVIPLIANDKLNKRGNQAVLLTKSANWRCLKGLPTERIAVTFSLNPEPIADLWEGKRPGSLERMTPPIVERLAASVEAQKLGFEVRWRLDPILTPAGWQLHYQKFFALARAMGCSPRRITLGTYREKTPQLDHWREAWGLPESEWQPEGLTHGGTHRHVDEAARVATYKEVAALIRDAWPGATPAVELCKETHAVREAVGFSGTARCNCLRGCF